MFYIEPTNVIIKNLMNPRKRNNIVKCNRVSFNNISVYFGQTL
jgi:hypothetical protein